MVSAMAVKISLLSVLFDRNCIVSCFGEYFRGEGKNIYLGGGGGVVIPGR